MTERERKRPGNVDRLRCPPLAPPAHTQAYRLRRFLNWFPLGLAYAFLYMGRYNLTVAKTNLGDLMSKEDFGTIFAIGTWVYGCAFRRFPTPRRRWSRAMRACWRPGRA